MRLKKAKYNEASFYIDSDETTGGRRIVIHEFPYADTHATEDLGKKATQWSITGLIVGAQYRHEAEELVKALEKKGIGKLNHPYIGMNKQVRCLSYRRSESSKEYGFIRFTMTFTEAGSIPEQTSKSVDDTSKNNQTFIDKTLHSFEEATKEVTQSLSQATELIDSFTEKLEDQLTPYMALRESVGDITTSLSNLKDATKLSFIEPVKLFNAVTNLCDFLIRSPMSTLDLLRAIQLSSFPFFTPRLTPESLSSIQLKHSTRTNKPELNETVKEHLGCLILIKMTEITLRNELTSIQNRKDQKEIVFNQFETFLRSTESLILYQLIQKLKSEFIVTLQKQDEQRSIRTRSILFDTNTILLSYEIYGDVNEESKLFSLNSISSCSSISKDTILEVA